MKPETKKYLEKTKKWGKTLSTIKAVFIIVVIVLGSLLLAGFLYLFLKPFLNFEEIINGLNLPKMAGGIIV